MAKNKTKNSGRPQVPRELHEAIPPGKHFKIRVLILHPGSNDDDIRCDLEVRTLKRVKNTYEAISYVWGDPNDTVDIECNGHTVPITVSLGDALRQFRRRRRTRRLWADALCINQSDGKEKGLQVSRMGQVYKNARRVLVWLGPDHDGEAKDSFDLMRGVIELLDAEFLQHSQASYRMPSLRSPLPILKDNPCGLSLETMISHPWFFRVWTVQESALARDCQVFWGPHHVSIADVVEFAWWCATSLELHGFTWTGDMTCNFRTFYMLFEDLHKHYRSKGSWHCSRPGLQHTARSRGKTCFALMLFGGYTLSASDARDHVYAFLGSLYARDGKGNLFIKADYSVSVDDVYGRIAQALVQDPTEGPWLLSSAGHTTREDVFAERPSWVPYWNTDGKRMTASPSWNYSAGGSIDAFRGVPTGDGRIVVLGFTFDTVIFQTAPLGDLSEAKRTTVQGNVQVVEPSLDLLWTEISAHAGLLGIRVDFDAFILTLLQGFYTSEYGTHDHMDYYHALCKDHLIKSIGVASSSTEILSEREDAYAHWVAHILEFLWCARLFLTEYGGIGLTQNGSVCVGDVCCVFLGATVPFILAPVEDGRYRLATDCYIHGIMGGELVDKLDAYDIVLE